MLDLDKRSIMYLPGVGPKKAEILQKEAGISSYEDMLFYFPYKYIDRSRFYKVAEVTGDMPYIQMKGRILFFDTVGEGRTKAVDRGNSRMGRAQSTWSGSKGLTMFWTRSRLALIISYLANRPSSGISIIFPIRI